MGMVRGFGDTGGDIAARLIISVNLNEFFMSIQSIFFCMGNFKCDVKPRYVRHGQSCDVSAPNTVILRGITLVLTLSSTKHFLTK